MVAKLLALVSVWAAATAKGAPMKSVALETLRVGAPGMVEVYAPSEDYASWELLGASSWSVAEARGDGVVVLRVLPAWDASEVTLRSETGEVRWAVASAPDTPLTLRPGVVQTDGVVAVRVSASDGLQASELRWVLGEGHVLNTSARDGGIVARLQLDASPYPRVVPIGVYREGRDEGVAWAGVSVRAQPSIPLEVEPGTRVELSVGEQRYGPWIADDSGEVVARVEQGPRDEVATAVLQDRLGNETRTQVPLARRVQPWLVGALSHASPSNEANRYLHLRAINGWGGGAAVSPRCAVNGREVLLVRVRKGTWWGPVPSAGEVRCASAAGTFVFRPEERPAQLDTLDLTIWPEEVSPTTPRMEGVVRLRDTAGREMQSTTPPVVQVGSNDGVSTRFEDGVWRWKWQGEHPLTSHALDVRARWDPPLGEGRAERLRVCWEDGVLRAQAMRADGRMAVEAAWSATVEGQPRSVEQTALGGVRLDVSNPDTSGAVRVELRVDSRTWRGLVVAGEPSPRPCGEALVSARKLVPVYGGLTRSVVVKVEPSVLRSGPVSVARVSMTLRDQDDRMVRGEVPIVETSEGRVGEVRRMAPGVYSTLWTLSDSEDAREASLTVTSGGLEVRTPVLVRQRGVQVAAGPWMGANMSGVGTTGVATGMDVDIRTRWLDDALLVRAGWSLWTMNRATQLDEENVSLRGLVTPISLAALLRQEGSAWAVWGGGGLSTGVEVSGLYGDGGWLARETEWVMGPLFVAGLGLRQAKGELWLEGRVNWLEGHAKDVGFVGNVGGVSLGAGYRLLY